MKRILLTTLLFIIFINCITYCFAFEIGEKQIKNTIESYESLLKYNNSPITTIYRIYQNEGKDYPAYCLNVDLRGADKNGYMVNGTDKIQDENVWKTIINGFPYKSVEELGVENEIEAFTATKEAIYTILYGRNTEDYSPIESEAGIRTHQAYLKIVEGARKCTESIVDDIKVEIISSSEKWQLDSLNKKYASKIYNLSSNVDLGNYKIELQGTIPDGTIITDLNNNIRYDFKIGEEFKVLIPIENLLKSDSFTIIAKSNLETKPVIYGKTTIPNTQNYALTGIIYEEKDALYNEQYYENISKIKIIKKEYGTEKRLAGVKFNLLDKDKKIVKENLVTDENGEILLEKMIPGLYYLQETETLENYNLNNDLLEINLELDQEFELIVTNTLKNVNEVNKSFDTIDVNPIKKLPVTGF